MVAHNTLTDPELHEPKGISSAPVGSYYVADGVGSGSWRTAPRCSLSYPTSSTAPYVKSVGTSDTVIVPTSISENITSRNFSYTISPTFRVTYTGPNPIIAFINVGMSCLDPSSATKHLEQVIYKNGTVVSQSRVFWSVSGNNWSNANLSHAIPMVSGDYLEVFDRSITRSFVNYGRFVFSINGVIQ